MEIIEDDEEIRELMLKISNKEITLCETCDAFFDYVQQVKTCDECKKKKKAEYARRPENKAKGRKYNQRPENKAKKREYDQRPENKAKALERSRSPEYKAKDRKRKQRHKKLREEEWFQLDGNYRRRWWRN